MFAIESPPLSGSGPKDIHENTSPLAQQREKFERGFALMQAMCNSEPNVKHTKAIEI